MHTCEQFTPSDCLGRDWGTWEAILGCVMTTYLMFVRMDGRGDCNARRLSQRDFWGHGDIQQQINMHTIHNLIMMVDGQPRSSRATAVLQLFRPDSCHPPTQIAHAQRAAKVTTPLRVARRVLRGTGTEIGEHHPGIHSCGCQPNPDFGGMDADLWTWPGCPVGLHMYGCMA